MSSRVHVFYAGVLFILVLGSQAFAVLFRVDSWPLTNYPMFAEIKRLKEASVFRLTVKLSDGREFPINNTGRPNWEEYQRSYAASDWDGIRDRALDETFRSTQDLGKDSTPVSVSVERFAVENESITQRAVMEIDATNREYHVSP